MFTINFVYTVAIFSLMVYYCFQIFTIKTKPSKYQGIFKTVITNFFTFYTIKSSKNLLFLVLLSAVFLLLPAWHLLLSPSYELPEKVNISNLETKYLAFVFKNLFISDWHKDTQPKCSLKVSIQCQLLK